jgi:hypothetical protein
MKLAVSVALLLSLAAADTDRVQLATFDGAKDTSFTWRLTNDPVMGGRSHSTWSIDKDSKIAKWDGAVEIVPSLKAPGFCNAETSSGLGIFAHFNDASPFTHIQLRARAFKPYAGYKLSFAADTLNPQFHSFKAPFKLAGDGVWHTVSIPVSEFSNDWSSYTGECSTKDPTGKQHVCCTEQSTGVCPTKKNLKDISQVGLWMEGAAGNFSIEVKSISAGFADTCSTSEYCCPDAKHCLLPSNISCSEEATACDGSAYPVCCPLTKLCVKAGNPCTTSCEDKGSYCCPDAKHCLTPTKPGVLCSKAAPCNSGEVCCPVTNICVKPGAQCDMLDAKIAPWWPAPKHDLVV